MVTATNACSIDGCEKPKIARGWCHMHYKRWSVHGDPNYHRTAIQRLMAKVSIGASCWEWTGSKMKTGYGTFYNGQDYQLVHRFSYENHFGRIPAGYQVDHTCHSRSCVNPDHLRLVTPKQNCENLSGPTSRSTTGVLGVSWAKHAGKWLVRVGHNGKPVHGGYFTDIKDAEREAISLRNRLFTHNDLDRRVA